MDAPHSCAYMPDIARAFVADDCVFWWREHDGMVPWGTRTIADADGRVTATFEIITLTGWAPA